MADDDALHPGVVDVDDLAFQPVQPFVGDLGAARGQPGLVLARVADIDAAGHRSRQGAPALADDDLGQQRAVLVEKRRQAGFCACAPGVAEFQLGEFFRRLSLRFGQLQLRQTEDRAFDFDRARGVVVFFLQRPSAGAAAKGDPAPGVVDDHGGDVVDPVQQLREHLFADAFGGLKAAVPADAEPGRGQRHGGDDEKGGKGFRRHER